MRIAAGGRVAGLDPIVGDLHFALVGFGILSVIFHRIFVKSFVIEILDAGLVSGRERIAFAGR